MDFAVGPYAPPLRAAYSRTAISMSEVTDRRSVSASCCASARTSSSILVVNGFLLMHVHHTCFAIPGVHNTGVERATQSGLSECSRTPAVQTLSTENPMLKADRQHSIATTSHTSRRTGLAPRYAEFAVKFAEVNALAAALTSEVRAAARYLTRASRLSRVAGRGYSPVQGGPGPGRRR